MDKTKAKYIGKILKPDHFPHGLLWIKTSLETLGIFITNDPDENYLLNYKPKLAELKNLLNIWKQSPIPKRKDYYNQHNSFGTINICSKYNRYS